ncbi:hypothetical protein M2152_001898 [Microbacteriaceae bacterium SG_E_30_P1]|uniref:Membrane protein DUF2142 n=1 Tax=Antiquaquibacter oligotrophicus TaxID=2880260 RepID=A0ABT6KNY6_9MICO|nr:DUF2142 domain-containing protein [Antiquaquibacter oligotrophicus]MDH6181716.1 hypothetical protein [Antiquaquibacter oligotrophicus]UDF12601.1 DUF2142 domain-containing protein [Antiquaquibacter oligotrophicus]
MPARRSTPRAWVVFLVGWLLFSSLSALWSLATPFGASPDEPAHLIKAASTVRGAFNNADAGAGSFVEVPQYLAWTHAQTCTAFNAEVTAACVLEPPGDDFATVEATTTAGRYNPTYYLAVGVPSLVAQDGGGIYAMRILSGMITSVFLALTLVVLTSWRSRVVPMIGFATALTPMVFFLSGSVNPNSLEVAATLAAFAAVAAVILKPDPGLLAGRATIIAIAGVVAANTRAISPIWVAIAVLVPFIFVSREQFARLVRTRAVIVSAAVVAVGAIAALLWLRLTNTVSTASEAGGEAQEVPYAGESPVVGFGLMIVRFAQHLREMIGVFGWLDTAAPSEVYALWGLLIGSLVVWAVVLLRGRALVFALTVVVLVPVVPALIQAAFITSGGWIWQGRYALPVFVIAAVGLGIVLADRLRLSSRSMTILVTLVAALWGVCHVLAYTAGIQRYSVGASGSWFAMFAEPQWQPPGGIVLTLAAFTAVTAVAAVLGARLSLAGNGELGAVEQVPEDVEPTLAR